MIALASADAIEQAMPTGLLGGAAAATALANGFHPQTIIFNGDYTRVFPQHKNIFPEVIIAWIKVSID
jgi:hypothetical protein